MAVCGIAVLFAACIGAVRLSYFQIQEIKIDAIPTFIGVAGTDYDAKELETTINTMLSGWYGLVIPKRFVFSVNGRGLEQRLLAALPRFKTISITKHYPHTLAVSYAKRIFFALLCNDAAKTDTPSCGYIDTTGFVYVDAPDASGSLIVKIRSDIAEVKVGVQAIDESTIKQMALFGDGVKRIAGLRLLSYELTMQAPDELRLNIADGFTLIVKKDDNPETVLQILRTILTQEIKDSKSKLDYVDLRFGNKAFYKFKKN